MLGKSNFVVTCLLAGTTSAVLNSEKINAYQKELASHYSKNQAGMPTYKPSSPPADYHPGV